MADMIAIQEKEFRVFADYIKENYGIHFKDEKKTLVEGRLNRVLASMNMKNFTEYINHVKCDKTGKAASLMLDRITTNYTYFMREPEHFHFLKDTVLPYLIETIKDKDLRIWSAACSTGEEPYTLAMVIDEFFESGDKEWDTKILATDISEKALSDARAGIYGIEKIADLPYLWRERYFETFNPVQCAVTRRIKDQVIFRNINLMNIAYPFRKKMHVIFCRNVMIYFDTEGKNNLIKRLYDITVPGGYLFIGHSESLSRNIAGYKYVLPAVYRKE